MLVRIILGVVATIAASTGFAAEPPPLDPALPYSAERREAVTYDVDYSVVVTPPYKTKKLRVWVPVPPTSAGQEVSDHEWTTFPSDTAPQIASEPTFGNRFAYFEFASPQ